MRLAPCLGKLVLLSLAGFSSATCVAATDPDHFDLYCTAKNVQTGEGITPFEYHIDVTHKQWCDDKDYKCGVNPHSLNVTDDRLWMLMEDGSEERESYVYRQTGAFHFEHDYPGYSTLRFEGACTRKPYMSQPAKLF